jgi:hypothetical protein
MTQPAFTFAQDETLAAPVPEVAPLPAASLREKLANHFKARPNVDIDGLELGRVAGSYAWRSRVAELRFPPYNMNIKNSQPIEKTAAGLTFKRSLYRYIPEAK